MRRNEKKIILDLLETITEGHRQYKKYKKANELANAVAVLASCQDSAISIGNAIEKSEGEGTESVRLLEKYCEDLYQLSNGRTGISLDSDIIKIRNCISEEIKVTLEVVFFPYKASMWDSMESIYLAFKERDDVNVYLVPIPYYNRNNDGTVDAMHVEDGLFPDNEKVTDWKAFDLEKIKPDIAFIHNPYDDMNFVTTVDPRFYSFELKKNVDCLVYCPYYSTVGGIPKGQGLCKSYFYADYILTQSKYQVNFYDESVPKNKFLSMGSPKFDKAIHLNNERINEPNKFYLRVPNDWKEKRKGKKVYFFNSSITWLLHDTSVFLDKIEYIFDVFLKHADVLLLWRPHPLLEETIKAMRPEYYKRYLSIKRKFVEKQIGIIDETPDISTSVAYSDCFIGDSGTSITSLFVATGKPLFILNNNILREPDDQDINDSLFKMPLNECQGGYIITDANQIYRCKFPLTNDITFNYVDRISDYYDLLYARCIQYGEKIYITPYCVEEVVVYHTDGNISKIKLKHCTDQPIKFYNTLIYKNYLILVPNEYYYIVRIDMDTGDVSYTEDLRKFFISTDNNYVSSCGGAIVFHDSLVIGSRDCCQLLIVDIRSLQYKVLEIESGVCVSTCKMEYIPKIHIDGYDDKESIMLLPYKGMTLTRFFPETCEIRRYNIRVKNFYCTGKDRDEHDSIVPFSSLITKGSYAILSPGRGSKFIKLDLITGKSVEWKFPISHEQENYHRYYEIYSNGRFYKYNNNFYWYSEVRRRIYVIDVSDQECKVIKEISVKFNTDEVKSHAVGFTEKSPWWTQYGLYEDAVNSLGSFLKGKVYGTPFDQQKELDSFKKVAVNLDGTCGQHVCDFLMKKMEL